VSKNGDEERIPVSSALAEAYALRLANGNLGYHLCPFRYDGLMDRFRSCCEKAGIAGVDLHCLRKTFICRHARADGNPKITQAFARHRDISITLGIYAEVNGLDLAGKADVA
jgi:integrase